VFGYYDATTYQDFSLGLYGPFGPGGELTGAAPGPNGLFPASAYVNSGDQSFFTGTLDTGSIAVFADATYNLGNWHLTLGGRYAYDNIAVKYNSLPSLADGFLAERLTNYHNFYAFTPRAVLRYDLTANSNVYISYSEGTKSGLYSVSGYLTDQAPLKQERLRDVEGGYKIQGSGWHFEASAFHYDYTNLQVAVYEGGTAFFQNAPSAEIYGADANWQGRIAEGLTLNVGAAYTHARYTDFPDAAYQYFDPVLGVVNSTRNVDGGTLQRSPEFTGDISLDYKHELFNGTLGLNATGSYQTVSSFDFADTLKENSHGILNLRADWTAPSRHWTFSLIGQNVTDTTYFEQVLANGGGFGATYGRPASITAQVQYKF
jgi:iron complex outermembrane receptor protein